MRELLRLIETEQRMLADHPYDRIARLERLVTDLQRRMAALQRQLAEMAPAQTHPAQSHAPGGPLRDEIRQILERDAGPKHGAAKRVLRLLADTDIGRSEQPSLRTVQWHVAQLRKQVALRE